MIESSWIGGFPFSSSGFNTPAKRYAENRPIELIDKQIEESKKSVKNYEKGESEFYKTNSKTKKLDEAQNYQKRWNKTYLSKENQLLENSPEQKAEKIAEQMKEAAKHGRLKEWEYNNVSPTANTPVRP